MIRLSCWIGVMGCAIGGKAVAGEVDQSLLPTLQSSPMKRFVDADVDESGSLNRREFANAAPKLARYFHLVDLDEDGEASLDEIMEAWRKYKDKLIARIGLEPAEVSDKPSKGEEKKAACLSDSC